MSNTDTQKPTHADPVPNLRAQSGACAPEVPSTNAQLPQWRSPSMGPPSAAKTRPPTLTELVTTHTRLNSHLNRLVQSSLKDLQADARALIVSLHRPIKTPSMSSTSSHVPLPNTAHPNHTDVHEVPSSDEPIPELSALLKRHAKYTQDVVSALMDLNEVSWFIGTIGFCLDGGGTPPLPSSIGSAPPTAPPSAASLPTGSSVPIPPSRPLAPLPSFPPSAAASTKPLPSTATQTRVNDTSTHSLAAPPPVASVVIEPSHSTSVPTEANTPPGSLLFAPEPSSHPVLAALTTSTHPLPPIRDRPCAPPAASTRIDPYIRPTTRITQRQLPSTAGMLGHRPPPEANKPPTINIADLFPLLEPPILSAITRHDLSPTELWQLDTRTSATDRNANLSLPIPTTSTASPNASTNRVSPLQRFPTLNSLLIPLTTYFRVLHASLASALTAAFSPIAFHSSFTDPDAPANPTGAGTLHVASDATQAYLAHLLDLEEQYEWDAVLAYHLAFHERRRVQMAVARGSGAGGSGGEGFNGWGVADGELIALYLFGREKNSARGMGNCVIAGTRTSNGVMASVGADKAMVGGEILGNVIKTSTGTVTSEITGSESVKVKGKGKSGAGGKRRR